ncbi:MAG: ABC transporter permease [Gemmatimonadales bacterium]
MNGSLYLAWRYLVYHRLKTAVLLLSITVILFVPVGLRVLVDQSAQQLTRRAGATPLVIGARGSALELVLNTLYFGTDEPRPVPYSEAIRVDTSGLALAIPMHTRFASQGHPIVGTSLEYLAFRGLLVASGRSLAMLGECLVGSRVAQSLGVGVGDYVISSPESVFDIAGVYPLRMKVVGVLAFADSPDDDAIFVDLKTSWIIHGLGHGHQDLAQPEASAGVLRRDSTVITANASVQQYNEITPDNLESFHFHGDLSDYPVSAVIAVPSDQRSSALLQGRYQADGERMQVVRPSTVMDQLLGTILTVQQFVTAGAVLLGLATVATAGLVFWLSLRLRRREMTTIFKIGAARHTVGTLMASEVVGVLLLGMVLAGGLTVVTSRFAGVVARYLVRM